MAGLQHKGPFVLNYPFADKGDTDHVIASQVFEVPSAEYVPLALNTTRSFVINGSSKTLYHIGDTPSGIRDQKFQSFTRRWANKPGTHVEFESYVMLFPGIQDTTLQTLGNDITGYYNYRFGNGQKRAYAKLVISKLTFDYFKLEGTPPDPSSITIIPAQTYTRNGYVLRGDEVYLCDYDKIYVSVSPGASYSWMDNMKTSPTATEFFALGAYSIVVDCQIRRYRGNIYERITRRVSPPAS